MTQTSFSSKFGLNRIPLLRVPSTSSITQTQTEPSAQQDEPALVRYAHLKQRDQNIGPSVGPRTITSPPKPEKWTVKDTTVNIANAFHQAVEDMEPATVSIPNNSWASGSRAPTSVPRSTSVEYEKETQSTNHRRFPPPPNRLAPPTSRSNGTGRKTLSKQVSVHQVPDSEGEEDTSVEKPPSKNERGKSPLEHVVDMTKRAFAPATFYLRQRSLEPTTETPALNGHDSSYEYTAEEREFQTQKASRAPTHKKGRMSLDNKAYRPSASDLDEDSDDDDDGKKIRRRKSKKKEPHGGPLTTLPTVSGYEKKKRRKGRGSKGNSFEMDDEESTGASDDHDSPRVSIVGAVMSCPILMGSIQRSAPHSRSRDPPLHYPENSGEPDSTMDIEDGLLHSIPEEDNLLGNEDYPSEGSLVHHNDFVPFSIGGSLGRIVNLIWRAFAGLFTLIYQLLSMMFMLLGLVFGTMFEVAVNRPVHWLSGASTGPLGKYLVVGLALWTSWYTLQSPSVSHWLPALTSRSSTRYEAPDVPAGTIAELAARLQSIENALSGLSVDHERTRSRQETGAKSHAELITRLGNLETRIREANERALEAEEQYKTSADQGLKAVRQEVELLQAQLEASGGTRGGVEGNDAEAREQLKSLEERINSVEGGVKEALDLGKNFVKAGSNAAWWNKLSTGKSKLTIKSSDGQDISVLIGQLVDNAVSQYGKDIISRPDFALHSSGAKVIPSLTSDTFEIRPSGLRSNIVGLVTGNGYSIGRPPVTALHHETHSGHCWPFAGSEGRLGIALSAPVYISHITIDHVAKEVATDMRSAPREMEVWGMVEGKDNIAKVKAWQAAKVAKRAEAKADAELRGFTFVDEPDIKYPSMLPRSPKYIRVASFKYDIYSHNNVQTFPVDEEVRNLGVDFGIVMLDIKNNWGRDEYTCLYRVRVHGEKMGEIPLPYPEQSV